jgi:hypothetical protein
MGPSVAEQLLLAREVSRHRRHARGLDPSSSGQRVSVQFRKAMVREAMTDPRASAIGAGEEH